MTKHRRARRLALLGAITTIAAALAGAPATGAAERAPKAAVAAAFERALDRFASPERIKIETTHRSRVDRAWSLVTGSYGKRTIWAAWVRRTDGRQRVQVFRTRNFDPPRPPCDLRPAFSEPSC